MMGRKPNYDVILHFSDWNYEDRYFQLKESQLREFRRRIKKEGMSKAWEWFYARIQYGEKPTNPLQTIKHGYVNMTLDVYFLDYTEPKLSISEWEI